MRPGCVIRPGVPCVVDDECRANGFARFIAFDKGNAVRVTITQEMQEVLKQDLRPLKVCAQDFRWDRTVKVNLREFSLDKAEALAAVMDTVPKLAGARAVARDCRAWIEAIRNGAGAIRARKMEHAAALLIETIRATPNKHVYELDDESAPTGAAWLGYFVASVRLKESTDDRKKREWIEINLVYWRDGKTQSTGRTLQPVACLGKTAVEMLAEAWLVLETDEHRAAYAIDNERFEAVYDRVGMQMIANGLAQAGVLDNAMNDDERYRWGTGDGLRMRDSRVVVDVFQESERERGSRSRYKGNDEATSTFWKKLATYDDAGELAVEDPDCEVDTSDDFAVVVPVHPFVPVFDLAKHERLAVHVANLKTYQYDKTLRDRLTLPASQRGVLDTLLSSKSRFVDVIRNKAGGVIILCQGIPGTGKTLTAEVYAEVLGKPLYSVQCSQLGIDVDTVEKTLLAALARGRRWDAVTLLDEADVYIHERGADLEQNAIVGVFLRVIEYHAGVLFLTTNRGDSVDDAILSRCTARIVYRKPEPAEQATIWRTLAEVNGVAISPETVAAIVADHSMTGRDIKNCLKLCMMVAEERRQAITPELVHEMAQYKPTEK